MFKKFRVYTGKDDVFKGLTAEILEEKLAKKPFKPCGSQELQSLGWASWNEDLTESLVVATRLNGKEDHFLIALKIEDRELSAKVVKKTLDEEISKIEKKEDRKVKGKEKNEMKDEVILRLLPKCFTTSHFVFLWLDLANSRIIIDQTSEKKCGIALNNLRECLGSLPVIPLNVMNTPKDEMTQWVKEGAPNQFNLGDGCTLADPSDKGNTVTVKGQDLGCDEVLNHINMGKKIKKLLLANDSQSFCLDEGLNFTGIKLSPELVEEFEESLGESLEDKQAFFEGSFILMAGVLQKLIDQTIRCFGGILDFNDAASEE